MKNLQLLLLFLVPFLQISAQSHFIPVWTGNGVDHMNFYVIEATIENQNMQEGDEIGIFDEQYCVGMGMLSGEIIQGVNYLSIVASKNDALPPEVNGFTPGDNVIIKLWDQSEQEEISQVDVTYIAGNPVFSIGGTVSFKVDGTPGEPVIPVADAGDDIQADEGEEVQLDGSGSYDPGGAEINYSWTTISEIILDDPGSETPGFTAPEVEKDTSFEFFLTVNNGGDSDSEPDTVVVTVLNVNKIPVITGQSDISTDEEVPVTITIDNIFITDPDNTYPSDFTLMLEDGNHYTLSGTELIPEVDYYGILEVPVKVSDGTDISDPFTLVVTVNNVNDEPVFKNFPSDTTIDRNTESIFTITAVDADPEDILAFSVTFDPGISQYTLTDNGNGEAELAVIPGENDPDPVEVTVSLTDHNILAAVEQMFTLNFSSTGINYRGRSIPVEVYVNPDNGSYYIINKFTEDLAIEIIDMTGSVLVGNMLPPGTDFQIILPAHNPGIYIVRYSGSNLSGAVKSYFK
ncbi:MAG: T9SS type A sorting domain-containing protein [Bacteroidales bacterium]|nr:T9SS type A sorting domain-containing protein [Bacteroidales bacterium]